MEEATETIEETQEAPAEISESAPEQPVEEEETTKTEEKAEEKQDEEPEWFKKRFAKMTRQRRDAERQAAEERARADRLERMLEQQLKQPEKPAQPQYTRPKPTLEQHEFDQAKYTEDLIDWRLEQQEAQATKKKESEGAKKSQDENVRRFEEKRTRALEEGTKEYDDFEDVVYSIPGEVMTLEMAAVALESEVPHKVLYYLGQNPKEAAQIAKMNPYRKAIAMGKIESKVSTTPKTTKAPPPSKTVKGKEPNALSSAELAKKDPKKWIEMRNAGKL